MKHLFTLSFCTLAIFICNAQAWQIQNSGFTETATFPVKIKIIDSQTAWLFGNHAFGTTCRETSVTTDGVTWTVKNISTDPDLGIITGTASSKDSAWALLFDFNLIRGLIMATADGGNTWIEQDSGMFNSPTSFPDLIYFWNSLEGIAVGDPAGGYYEIYRTMDGGENWTRVDSANIPTPTAGEAALVNDFEVVEDNIWFGALNNRVYHSTDRGQTWTVSALNADNDIAGPFAFKNELDGIAMVTKVPSHQLGGMFATSDGGNSWSEISYTGTVGVHGFANIPGTSTYVSCASYGPDEGWSSYSTDDCLTWHLIDTTGAGTDAGYASLAFIDSVTGWAGGFTLSPELDGVYRWSGEITEIKSVTTGKQPSVFPNPADDYIMIDFNNSFTSHYYLQIKTIDGRTLYSESFLNELDNKKIDVSKLQAGIYLLSISNDSMVYLNKLVIK